MELSTKKIAEEVSKLPEPEARELIALLGEKYHIKIVETKKPVSKPSKWNSLVNDIENDNFYKSKNVSDFCKEVKKIHSELNDSLFSE